MTPSMLHLIEEAIGAAALFWLMFFASLVIRVLERT